MCMRIHIYIHVRVCVYTHLCLYTSSFDVTWISRRVAGTVQSSHPSAPASQTWKSSHLWFYHWLARDRRVFSAYIFINFNSMQLYCSLSFMRNKHSWTHSVSWDMKHRRLCTGDAEAVISLLWKRSTARQDVAVVLW